MDSESMPKVNILLSSYNGAQYIREQIESLLKQNYGNIKIYIRDDGSTDSTRAILREYSEDLKFNITFGRNLGFASSFMDLLKNCDDADYYAFCDQDDVWLPEKISRAVSVLRNADNSIPALYFSGYEFADENLNISELSSRPKNLSFANCLVDCAPLGFTTVINNRAREEIVRQLPAHSCGHDWWAYMVCRGLGNIIYDDYISVKYRRYTGNVSSGGADFLKFQIWRFKKFFLGSYFSNITQMLREYEAIFGNRLSSSDCELLSWFTNKTIGNALFKCFYPHKFRQGMVDEIFLRLCFLLGRL